MSDQPCDEIPTGELVKWARDNHAPQAWELLIARFSRLVRAVVRSYNLSEHDAQDAEQTVWCNLADHLDRLRIPERVGAWLATTAHYECRKQIRLARRSSPADPTRLEAVNHRSPELLHLETERAQRVRQAIAELDEPDRTVATLDLHAPRSPASTIAEFTGLETEEVAGVRRRARRHLRRRLSDEKQQRGL